MSTTPQKQELLEGRPRRIVMEELARAGRIADFAEADALAESLESLGGRRILEMVRSLAVSTQAPLRDAADSEVKDGIAVQRCRLQLEKCQSTLAMQAESLSRINHDVRGMMTGVMGMIELLNATEMDEQQEDYLSTMESSSKAILRILGDALEFAKLSAADPEVQSEPMDLPAFLEDLAAAFQPKAATLGVEFKTDFSENLPSVIKTDATRLRQVLGNLLENAFKFTSGGSVGISAWVQTSNGSDAGEVVFEVTDTGIGIAKERLQEIFHPYVQIGEDRPASADGVGLGLAIVRNLVRLMEGSVVAKSTIGEGSTFTVMLPNREGVEVKETPEEPVSPIEEEDSKRSVLVVEDDPVNQTFTVATARRLGYRVDLASNGQEAVDMAKDQDYEAILMDIAMPVMDGVEATRRIRKMDAPCAETRIIAITGHVFEQDQENYRNAGMDGFLAKPFGMKDLDTVLRETEEKAVS